MSVLFHVVHENAETSQASGSDICKGCKAELSLLEFSKGKTHYIPGKPRKPIYEQLGHIQ